MTRDYGSGLSMLLTGWAMSLAISPSQSASPVPPTRSCPVEIGRSPSDPSTIWRPPAGLAHGVHEFTQTAQVAFPTTMTTISVEVWAGGGGGGGGSFDTYMDGGAGGGGGSSGAYVRSTIDFPAGAVLTVVVGEGGRGGDATLPGQPGGSSAVCRDGVAVLFADGGAGGQGAATNGRGGRPGGSTDDRAAGMAASNVLARRGNDGLPGDRPLFEYRGAGGRGGAAVTGSIVVAGSFGGDGGAGEMRPAGPGRGAPGGAGRVIVTW